MSGIGMVLNTAKHAIEAQQISINVTGQNIANVNTAGYSRQTAIHESLQPVKIGPNILGTGVKVDQIVRSADILLEGRLNEQKSNLSGYKEANTYMSTLESLFNENSETGLSSQISEFWNSWQKLSNLPSGPSERVAVYDTADRLSQQFGWLNENMRQMETDLTKEIDAGVNRINTLSKQIAAINLDIVSASVNSNPNDQLDKRSQMIAELAGLIDIRTFDQANGSTTVVTSTGSTLVYGADSYLLEQKDDRIIAVDATGSGVDLTGRIKGGKLAGWLSMRDEVIPKYRSDLDSLTEELIWTVNQAHSQGVGLDYFANPMTGVYGTDDSGMFGTLSFGNRIDPTGDFKMWMKDTGTSPPGYSNVSLDMNVSPVDVNNWAGSVTVPGSYQYRMTVTTAGTVGPAGANPVISWEKFNPDGTTTGTTGVVTVTDVNTLSAGMDGLTFDIGAGELYAGNTFNINTNAAGAVNDLSASVSSGTANSANDTYVFKVKTPGVVGTAPVEIEWHNSVLSGTFTLTPGALPLSADVDGMTVNFASGTAFAGDEFTMTTDASGYADTHPASDWHWSLDSFVGAFNAVTDAAAAGGPGSGHIQASVNADNKIVLTPQSGYQYAFSDDQVQDSGVAAALGLNTFFSGDDAATIKVNTLLVQKDFIAAGKIDGNTGKIGAGDNQNAIAIADLQYDSRAIAQWTFSRSKDSSSRTITATIEGYYQGMIGSMGVKAESILRNEEFAKVMVDKLGEQRDSISGVNLDEEMINLMKFQHAFSAASRLISTADEMLQTLLAIK